MNTEPPETTEELMNHEMDCGCEVHREPVYSLSDDEDETMDDDAYVLQVDAGIGGQW